MSETKKTFRQKCYEWADNHPQTVLAAGYVMTMTGLVAAAVVSTKKAERDFASITQKNNKLLAERRDKANDFASSASASGESIHLLDNGGMLSIPSDTPQKIHFV
jgi:hypothetical protein